MKQISILLVILGMTCRAWAQPTPAAPATQAEVNAGTVRTKFVSPATLAGAGLSNGMIQLGAGASAVWLSATNGPASGGLPIVYWSEYADFNTNQLFMSGFYQAGGNTSYGWSGSALTNGANTRWFTNISGIWGYVFNGTLLMTNPISLTAVTTWGSVNGGTNVPCATIFGTNAVYGQLAWGTMTNQTGLTNGAGAIVYSNGAAFLITSRVGATNQTRTNLWPAP